MTPASGLIDGTEMKNPVYYRRSLVSPLLALATPLLVVIAHNLWDWMDPLPKPDPLEPAPLMAPGLGRGIALFFCTFLWWGMTTILAAVFAIIAATDRESGTVKSWAIGTTLLTFFGLLFAFLVLSKY